MADKSENLDPSIDPVALAEIDSAAQYAKEIGDGKDHSDPIHLNDKEGLFELIRSGGYLGNLHYGSDQGSFSEVNDESLVDFVNSELDVPNDSDKVFEPSDLDSEVQPFQSSEILQTQDSVTGQGTDASFIPLPLPNFAQTADILDAPLEQTFESSLRDSVSDQNLQQGGGSPETSSSGDFTSSNRANATGAAGSRSNGDGLETEIVRDTAASAPTLTANDVSGNEDSAIALDLTSGLTDTDGSESLSIVVSGVPTGASLSAGTDNGDGTWTLIQGQLSGLTLTPPSDSDADFTLTVTSTSTEATGGDTAQTVDTFDVTVNAVADAPTVTANDVSGNEDTAITLDIASALTDTDGSESLSVVVSGVPTGASLSAGTDNGDGTWTLTQGQLTGLTLTPPADSDADFTLTVTSTATDGSDTAQTVDTFDVTVNAVADAPTVTANDVSGNEDTAITLDIASALTDTDGSESLSVVVSGVPTGASLSAGTDNGDGTWTLTQGQLTGLTLTPPADSDADFTLTVTSTATDGSDTAQTVDTFDVTVNAVADAPTVTANDVSGNEDTAITLNIASALTDTDGSESLSVVVSGVPTGASLSAGTDNGDGTWTLTQGQLSGLTLTPPADSDADFTLTVTSTATDGSDTAQTVDTFDVTVNAVADAPTDTANDVSGNEDTAITLNIASALTDTDGSESLSVVVSGVPTGASLSAGTDNGDGTWTLTQAQLTGLTLTPPADSDTDFTLTATSTATDGSDTAQTVDTFNVAVSAVADAPTVTANDVSGNEDTAIALDITSALTDTDGSESLSVVVSGVPTGASLSAGTDNGDGTWTLTQGQLTGLTLTPPADSDADFTLTVTATATDGSDTAQTVDTFDVTVNAVADAPTVTANDVSGNEDTAITLDITSALTDTDGSESLSVVVSGVPTGASLSAGTDNGDGTWTLTQGQLTGLTLTPPADSDADFTLTVTSTATDGSDTAQTVDTFNVAVSAVADAPTVTANDVSGNEDTAIALDITSALTDTDGSESLSVVVSGVPTGASLSAGTDNGDGTWTLTQGQLTGLTLTPPADSDADFTLTVTATATDGSDTAQTVDTFDVTVNAVADAPTVTANDVTGNEDAAIALDISSALTDTDGSESLSVVVSGVPTGASLSAGTDNGDGTWTLTQGQLTGLTITPPADSDADFTLTVTATATDGSDTAQTVDTFDVTVSAVADAPTVTANDVSGNEDAAITLDITSALTDTDGSESLSVVVSGVPTGASLSAGTDNGDGTWTLTQGQLTGLTLTPPADSDADFTLTVTSTATDGSDTAQTVDTFNVAVSAVADAPTVTANDVSGNEDTAITLDITSALTDTDGSESLSVVVSGVPTGASLSAGTDNGDGTWTLTQGQLSGLTITPPADSDADFTLTVTSTATDGSDTAQTVDTFNVTVSAVADAPTVTANDVSGNEDTAITLDIASALTDTDGSESLSVVVSGVPTGASLSAGTDNGDGTWTLTQGQLSGLTITPPADSDADFTLTVTSTATDGSDTAQTVDTFNVTVSAVADAPTVTANDVSGNEDTAITLDITSALTDTDGSESLSVVVSGVPTGASLSAGTDNGDGTWTLTQGQLTGLTLTPPADSDADFTLTVTSTATDGSDTAQTVDTFNVAVSAVADAPTVTANDVSGNEDTAIALDITSALTDTDGSESLSVVVSGVPTGASLSAGTDNGDGTWTLTQAQLTGLTLTPPSDSDADFTLTVTATATDGSDTAQTVDTFNVAVSAVADAPTVTANDVSGNEDTAITLDITSALTDTDGSESLSVVVSGVPTGASLSAGTDNGDGTWTLTQGQLTGLTLTPPADSDADFTLTVTSTATDGSDTAQTVDTFNVAVSAVADAPTVTANDVSGNEDTAIALDITSALTDTDGSESLSVVVSGVPTGASLSAGTDNGDGTWTLTQAQLTGLT